MRSSDTAGVSGAGDQAGSWVSVWQESPGAGQSGPEVGILAQPLNPRFRVAGLRRFRHRAGDDVGGAVGGVLQGRCRQVCVTLRHFWIAVTENFLHFK